MTSASSPQRDSMICCSKVWDGIFRKIQRVAPFRAPVLITGETGVGKLLVARKIHQLSGRKGDLVKLSCANFPCELFDSELFGHQKGAFTGAVQMKVGLLETAEGGTLLLDDVDCLDGQAQAKLLGLFDEGEFRRLGGLTPLKTSARILATSNQSLPEMVAAGAFREDLFCRLNEASIFIPPLRERPTDVLPLIEYFLTVTEFNRGGWTLEVDEESRSALMYHPWPGNARKVRTVVNRALLDSDENEGILSGSRLKAALECRDPLKANTPTPLALQEDSSFEETLKNQERKLLVEALQKAAENQTRAAVALGITRDTLRYKMKKFHLR
jgi:transcriptional regulator with PAS, ATPase and Fis domain